MNLGHLNYIHCQFVSCFQCFKDILSTVVSKESWTISFMQLVNIQAPFKSDLEF